MREIKLRQMPVWALMALSSPAGAAPIIWNDLEVGMTPEQVQEKYPAARTSIGDDCEGEIKGSYASGKLVAVVLFVKPTPKDGITGRARCARQIETGLTTKYGAPVGTRSREGNKKLYDLGDESIFWKNGNVKIELRVKNLGNATTLVYNFSPDDHRQADPDKL